MKTLYYSTCSFATPQMGVLINAVKNEIQSGNEVFFSYCSQAQHSCFRNENANGAICKLCSFTYNNIILKQLSGATIIPVHGKSNSKPKTLEYSSIDELKLLSYKDIKIGMSILSYYFSVTRNIDFEITPTLKKYFDSLISCLVDFVDNITNIINDVNPDKVVIYNGRYYENRVLYDYAKTQNINFYSYDVVGGFNEPYYPVRFDECLPHGISFFANKANEVWKMASELEKYELAKSFFEKRRNGDVCCDKSYTSGQIQGKLPSLVSSKKNIVIFNSSSDELAAIGGEWDEGLIFDNQYEAIKYILNNISPDYHVYLRIHPNLKGINQPHHLDLYKLEDVSKQITIISPEEDISSYALLDIAGCIVVFGSTMGVEACYWQKPSILVGHSLYEKLDVCYKPQSKEELINMINSDLCPKPKEEALKYSFYLLDRKYRVDPQNVDFSYTPKIHSLFGKEFATHDFLKIFGSCYVYQFIEYFYRYFVALFYRDKNPFILPKRK